MTRPMICKNPNSKFKGILRLDYPIYFIFYVDSENCFFPVNSSLFELLNDGWEIIPNKATK